MLAHIGALGVAVVIALASANSPNHNHATVHSTFFLRSAFDESDGSSSDGSDDVAVVAGNGNGGQAIDSVTLLAEAIGRVVNEISEVAGDDIAGPITTQGSVPTIKDPMSGLGQSQPESYCGWASLANPLDANDPAWEGHTSADGEVKWKSCAILGEGTPDAPGNLEGRPVVLQFFPNAVLPAVAPPPPSPEELAQRAIRQLRVPEPQIGAGPNRAKLAVNLWTWLWTDDPGPLTATAAAGGVSVTATATLESVTWSLGEPAPTGGAYAPGPAVSLTCQGSGTPPPPDYDWKAEPPCGHKYTWMSTKERTGGAGTWPVTATSNWTVTWQSNTGVTGTATLNSTSNDALEIGEYRIVLVQGPGG